MKYVVLTGIIVTLTAAFAVPSVLSNEGASASSTEVVVAQETAPPSTPQGVSGATPDIRPPSSDTWVCPKCGAESPIQYRGGKRGRRGPQLGAEAGRRGAPRCDRGERYCEPQGRRGKGMREGRGKRSGKRHGHFAGQGQRQGVAADRMLRHASALELTNDQIGKLEMLSYEAKKKLIDLHASIEKEQLELKNRMRSDAEDMSQIKRHLSAIANAKVGIQEVKISNMFAAKKILTDEQKELVKKRHPRMGTILD